MTTTSKSKFPEGLAKTQMSAAQIFAKWRAMSPSAERSAYFQAHSQTIWGYFGANARTLRSQ